MPYVKIEIARDGVTRDQKIKLVKGVTQLLVDVLNKDPQLTHIVISEVDTDNWGVSGKLVSETSKPISINGKPTNK